MDKELGNRLKKTKPREGFAENMKMRAALILQKQRLRGIYKKERWGRGHVETLASSRLFEVDQLGQDWAEPMVIHLYDYHSINMIPEHVHPEKKDKREMRLVWPRLLIVFRFWPYSTKFKVLSRKSCAGTVYMIFVINVKDPMDLLLSALTIRVHQAFKQPLKEQMNLTVTRTALQTHDQYMLVQWTIPVLSSVLRGDRMVSPCDEDYSHVT
ncbi:hypothetical protein SAY87_004947 [Trapa incisa]|uniref:Uncharacterized protein n=1 Tax=Trapa incisa TaxID=236973 RepID=A0AAN7JQ36_9MYRT|nr:hypothetical protein SAY87_004947 [Trapa incisa]